MTRVRVTKKPYNKAHSESDVLFIMLKNKMGEKDEKSSFCYVKIQRARVAPEKVYLRNTLPFWFFKQSGEINLPEELNYE